MEEFEKTSMLFDIYGVLAYRQKKRVMEIKYEDDMSQLQIGGGALRLESCCA